MIQDCIVELPRGRRYAICHDLEVWAYGDEGLEWVFTMVQMVFL